jgi:SPASM domain peptide maturase of grasp-with-spasm system
MRYYRLFSNCFPVFGIQSSAIYDVTREKYHCIPNSLFEILTSHKNIYLDRLKEEYCEDLEILSEYFEFLISEDLIFECPQEELENFPKIDLAWDYPALITNAVIEVDSSKASFLAKILSNLDVVGCRFIQIRLISFSKDTIHELLSLIEENRFNSIEIIINHSHLSQIKSEYLFNILSTSKRRFRVIIEYSNSTEFKRMNDAKDLLIEVTSSYDELKRNQKGAFFHVNMDLYMESQKFNNYLNRKMFVDSDGIIKNSKFSENSFNTVQELKDSTAFKEIIKSELFMKNWLINKDMIKECSLCEFRYMCVDDRELISYNNDTFGFAEPCSFRQNLNDSLL